MLSSTLPCGQKSKSLFAPRPKIQPQKTSSFFAGECMILKNNWSVPAHAKAPRFFSHNMSLKRKRHSACKKSLVCMVLCGGVPMIFFSRFLREHRKDGSRHCVVSAKSLIASIHLQQRGKKLTSIFWSIKIEMATAKMKAKSFSFCSIVHKSAHKQQGAIFFWKSHLPEQAATYHRLKWCSRKFSTMQTGTFEKFYTKDVPHNWSAAELAMSRVFESGPSRMRDCAVWYICAWSIEIVIYGWPAMATPLSTLLTSIK